MYKSTKSDDGAEFAHVSAAMKTATCRVHEDDVCEAVRLIRRAAFGHNKENVINAPMASFLLRNESRFFFSHEFIFCPLKDLVNLHEKADVSYNMLVDSDESNFFENQAIHYLCRPSSLENVCAKDFVEEFRVTYWTSKNQSSVTRFLPGTDYVKHPSVSKNGKNAGKTRQGVQRRESHMLCSVSQWQFPDTALFKADIMSCSDHDINEAMEKYAQLLLTLLLPHRKGNDLKKGKDNPFTNKLREVYKKDMERRQLGKAEIAFTEANEQFLQNLQNSARNSMRYTVEGDELSSMTHGFRNGSQTCMDQLSSDSEEEFADHMYDYAVELLEVYSCLPDDDHVMEARKQALQRICWKYSKDSNLKKGRDLRFAVKMPAYVHQELIIGENEIQTGEMGTESDITKEPLKVKMNHSAETLVTVLLKRSVPKVRNVFEGKSITVPAANGSVKSIMTWAREGLGGDKMQGRAFEVIVSSFLLTFFKDLTDKNDVSTTDAGRTIGLLRRTKNALRMLKGVIVSS
jgi:hypothetical protein